MGTVLVFTMNSKGGNQPREHSEKCGYNGSHEKTGAGSNARYSSTSHTAHQMLWLPAEIKLLAPWPWAACTMDLGLLTTRLVLAFRLCTYLEELMSAVDSCSRLGCRFPLHIRVFLCNKNKMNDRVDTLLNLQTCT